jgi:hypothetical protein
MAVLSVRTLDSQGGGVRMREDGPSTQNAGPERTGVGGFALPGAGLGLPIRPLEDLGMMVAVMMLTSGHRSFFLLVAVTGSRGDRHS